MKFRRYILLCLSLLLIFCLSGCKKEPKRPENFGNWTQTETTKSNNSGKEIEINNNTNESSESSVSESSTEDQFAITNIDLSKTDEDKSIEKAESEAEQYTYINVDGEESDIRQDAGLDGILSYIYNMGGVAELSTLDREILKNRLDWYFAATEEEKEQVLHIIYAGTEEEKKELDEAALHTQEGWVYTDEGWKNVYSETNASNPNIGNGLK